MSDENKIADDFIDDDNVIKMDVEFMDVYKAFGYGQLELQKTIIFFKKALIETEDELTKNPESINMQQRKAEIENYLCRIHKIMNPEYQSKKAEPVIVGGHTTISDDITSFQSTSIKLQVDYLFSVHPKFKIYFPIFKEADYIDIRTDCIWWKKSKAALTKFIKLFAGKREKYHWSKYEKLFNRKSLRTGEGEYPDKTCSEYDDLVKKVEGESK